MTQPYRPEPTESKRVLASRSPEFLKIDQSRKSKTRPPGSLRCRVPSRTAAYLRTSSTSAGASPGHTARRRSRLGPAARTAQSQCDGSRYTLRQRTCSGIRIWSGTETLATARKHGKRPAHPPPPRRNTGGRHYFRALWTPWTPLCTPISIVVFGDNSGSVELFLKNPRLTASMRLQNSVYPRPFARRGGVSAHTPGLPLLHQLASLRKQVGSRVCGHNRALLLIEV